MLILFLVVQNVVESIATQDGCDELKEHINENSKDNPTRTQKSIAKPQNFLELLPTWLHSFEEFQNECYKNKGTL